MYTAPTNVTQLYLYPIQHQLNTHQGFQHPPPGLNHPMVTIAQQPNVFKPTLLPAMTSEPGRTSPVQPTQEDTRESSTIAVTEATNPVESMDAQP